HPHYYAPRARRHLRRARPDHSGRPAEASRSRAFSASQSRNPDVSHLAARGGTPVGRVASAALSPARSGDAGTAGHWRGAATQLGRGAAATPSFLKVGAGRIWPDSWFDSEPVARRPGPSADARLIQGKGPR